MKNRMITNFISIVCMLFTCTCNDNSVDPHPLQPKENMWEEIPLFKNADIRYMKTHNNVLYISAVFHSGASAPSVLYSTIDGETWDTLKTFISDTGPITFYGDTLTILETGRIWDYHPSFGWKLKYKTLIGAWITFDMFYIRDELFVFEHRDYAFSRDTLRAIRYTPIESRFVTQQKNGKIFAYTIPYYIHLGVPHRFDGHEFYPLANGISPDENKTPNYPGLGVFNDTLYAGFNTPTRIKKLVNDIWVNVTDTIVNSKDAYLFSPHLKNTASSILIHNNRMFVGTECTGVLEWTDDGWISISKGLQSQFPDHLEIEFYSPIIFLEYINGKLITGYGEPGFAPLYRGKGIYRYTLE